MTDTERADEFLARMSDEEKEVTVAALLAWRKSGVRDPQIPIDIGDIDEDGLADAFALGEDDRLVIVTATPIEYTVSQSTGGGLETDREEPSDG